MKNHVDWTKDEHATFWRFVDSLRGDIYEQPEDEGHTDWSLHALNSLWEIVQNVGHPANVLDIGAGTCFMQPHFESLGLAYTGLTLGADAVTAKTLGRNVKELDMTFLNDYEVGSVDLIWARHVLEHSPFPLITLMEWRRVVAQSLVLIAPTPNYWGYKGKNHYSVLPIEALYWLLNRAGWEVVNYQIFTAVNSLFVKHNPDSDIKYPKPVEFWLVCRPISEVKE